MSATPIQSIGERDQLIRMLEKSERDYLRTVEGISDSAAQARLNDESWSILQVAEHVAVSEHGMFRAIELGQEKTSPADFEADKKIQSSALDRSSKGKAPERSNPKGRWKTMAEAVDAFRKSRARTIEMVKGSGNLRRRVTQHLLYGELDAHQVVMIMALHAERHALQIEEIKHSSAYKKAAS